MTHKEATKTKACSNCIHCKRIDNNMRVVCYCDIDNHHQGYLEVIGSRCELWEKEDKE